MTAKQIESALGKERVLANDLLVCANVNYVFVGQCDLIAVNRRKVVTEYEIKISRQDFFRDAKKARHFFYENPTLKPDKVPNHFYYVVPIGLIEVEEVPDWAGLIYVNEQLVTYSKKKGPMITKHKHDIPVLIRKCVTLFQERNFLGCCLMTYKNKQTRENNKKIHD
jgi:hypothetical protein